VNNEHCVGCTAGYDCWGVEVPDIEKKSGDVLHTFDVVVRVKLDTDQIDIAHTLINYAYMGREKFTSLIWSEDPAADDHVAASSEMRRSCDMTIKVDMLTDGTLRLA